MTIWDSDGKIPVINTKETGKKRNDFREIKSSLGGPGEKEK